MENREFCRKFKEQWDFAAQIESTDKHCVVKAPVKSGKRIMVEALTRRSRDERGKAAEQHVFLTSLNRKDTKKQLEELEKSGVVCWVISGQKQAKRAMRGLEKLGRKGTPVVIHFDESDYGTAARQLLSGVWRVGIGLGFKFVCYSATNEEIQFSDFAKDRAIALGFTPHPNYRGARFYLQRGLVFEAEPFFYDNEPTKQALEAMEFFVSSDKAISVLRAVGNYNNLKGSEEFEDFLRDYKVKPLFIDGSNPFVWEEDYKPLIKDYEKLDIRYLLVINQTCTRSTEVKFHKHIAFWHDYRGPNAAYNTCHQAFLRVAHYYEGSGPENEIRVYAIPEVFRLAAQEISQEDFCAATGRKLSGRVDQFDGKTKYREYTIEAYNLKEEDKVLEIIKPIAGPKAGIATTKGQKRGDSLKPWFSRLKEFDSKNVVEAKAEMTDASYAIKINGPHPKSEASQELYKKFRNSWPDHENKILVLRPLSSKVFYKGISTSKKSMYKRKR